MTTIFVISQSEGSYEDYRSWPVAATYDEQKAKDYVADMEQRLIKANAARDQIELHMTAWAQANPRADFKRILHNPPFFKGPKKKWTPEQKEQLKRYEEQYQKDCAEAIKPLKEWSTKCYEERVRVIHTYPHLSRRYPKGFGSG
jgi:hypothetical protein